MLPHHVFLCSDYAAVIMTEIMKVVAGTAETTTTFFVPEIFESFLKGKQRVKLNIQIDSRTQFRI